jgi:NAD-dependent dihydropyrimidine dehydrogenase PreA subunit
MISTPTPLLVVLSQGQSRAPEKRALEQAVAEAAALIPGVSTVVIPHLYDLPFDGPSLQQLRTVNCDLVVVSWMFERASHWILDRGGVRGQFADVKLQRPVEDDAGLELEAGATDAQETRERVAAQQPRPERAIYCIDFRVSEQADAFVEEIRRIAELPRSSGSLERFQRPTNDTALGLVLGNDGLVLAPPTHPIERLPEPAPAVTTLFGIAGVSKIDEHPTRRWYPVIDYSRCTNCMECIDFCLFGVYGVDRVETILVEQPDNCRKGCPACSRVCPENAIIFPQHKSPAIAGAPLTTADSFKIDLSKLFGAPDEGEDAVAAAIRERDEQLILAGRSAVGDEVGIRPRRSAATDRPRDALDELLDELEQLDL